MTAPYFFGLVVGTLAGILGTLSALAIHRWFEAHPKPLEHDPTLERLRRL